MKRFVIRGSGMALPPGVLLSEEIDQQFKLSHGTTYRKSGIQKRHRHVRGVQTVSSLGKMAVESALEKAELKIGEIDLLIAAGATPDQLIPTNSVLLHSELNAPSHLQCLDIDSTCLSFLSALDLATDSLTAGSKNRILIVNSELGGSGIDSNNFESQCLFGDAAVAFILEKSEKYGMKLHNISIETFSKFKNLCQLEGGGSRYPAFVSEKTPQEKYHFQMDGPDLFKAAFKHLPEFTETFLKSMNLDMKDIDIVVPHQASASAINLISRRLNIPKSKLVEIVEEYGNCLSASIPMGLHLAMNANASESIHIKEGNYVLLIGTGAGLSLGICLLEF